MRKITPKIVPPATQAATIDMIADAWSRAAAHFGVTWYLYDTSLLCAEVLGHTPERYNEWTVAVQSRDQHRVFDEVMPYFQDLTNCLISVDGTTATCTHPDSREVVVLHVGLIRPASPQEAMYDTRLRVSTRNKKKSLRNHPIPYPEPAETVTLNGVTYPTFANYREYLGEFFLDYEDCFADPMGCNLTIEAKEDIRQHQQNCLEALQFLEELSQKYGLKYRLLAGSVLGAVRHGGFIPWDDDIDVGICVEDLPLIEEKVQEHLPEKFEFFVRQPDINYPRMFSKICCEGRCCIDLFPLLPVPKDGWRAEVYWVSGKFWRKLHYYKIGHYSLKHFDHKWLARLCALFLSDKQVMRIVDRHDRRYADKNAPCYVNLYSIYTRQKETVPAEWVKNPERLTFEGLDVPVMGSIHDYLTHMYGNYMSQPFPWNRAHHHAARFKNTDPDDDL